jgi:hypothetical protein
MMLRETLKQDLDHLSENQLRQIAEFVNTVKTQTPQPDKLVPFWQSATPIERADDFLAWITQLPKTQVSLPDEAFDRGNLYE